MTMIAKINANDINEVVYHNTEGTAEINVSQSSIFSSILPQRLAAAKFDPQAAVIRVESVRVARLDDVLLNSHRRRI
jgi:hypothetical protein